MKVMFIFNINRPVTIHKQSPLQADVQDVFDIRLNIISWRKCLWSGWASIKLIYKVKLVMLT